MRFFFSFLCFTVPFLLPALSFFLSTAAPEAGVLRAREERADWGRKASEEEEEEGADTAVAAAGSHAAAAAASPDCCTRC